MISSNRSHDRMLCSNVHVYCFQIWPEYDVISFRLQIIMTPALSVNYHTIQFWVMENIVGETHIELADLNLK